MSSSCDFIELLKGLSEPTATPKVWMWMRDGLSPRYKERILAEAPNSLAARILTGRVDVEDQKVAPLTIDDADSVPLPDDEEDFRCTTPTASNITASSTGILDKDEVLDADNAFSGYAVICWHSDEDEGFYAQPLEPTTEVFVLNQPAKPIHLGDWIWYKSVRQDGQPVIIDYQVTQQFFPTSSANGSTTVECSMVVPVLGGPPFNGYLLSQISPMTRDPLRRIQMNHRGEMVQVTLQFCYEHGAEYGYWQIEQIQ